MNGKDLSFFFRISREIPVVCLIVFDGMRKVVVVCVCVCGVPTNVQMFFLGRRGGETFLF